MTEAAFKKNNRLLVIDDNQAIHADFKKILAPPDQLATELQAAGAALFDEAAAHANAAEFEIDSAFSGEDGLALVQRARAEGRPYALAFVDVRMAPGWDGIETTVRIFKNDADIEIVICTAYSDYSWDEMMEKIGQSDRMVILKKPFDTVEVMQMAHAMTEKWELKQQARARMDQLERMVAARTRELQAANDALQLSEERFARAFRSNPVPLLLSDAMTGRCVDVNDSFLALTGFSREELLGHAPDALRLFCRPEVENEIRKALPARLPLRNRQMEFHARDGKHFTALLSAERLDLQNRPHALMSLQDITERINIEGQLRQAQKMEAVGQIAAGVAHDFNNLLAVIQGHAEMQMGGNHLDPSLVESLQEISQAADRAASLTRQLLAFSRKQMLRPRALDLSELLHNLGKMLQRIIGEDIHLQIHCAENLPPVLADQTNLEQVIINLAVNARDAMPRGGPLTISAELAVVDAPRQEQQPDALLGTFVKLSVADKGVGMDQAVRRKIFEPFFTTKAVGKGTGMGLATVYGIVKQHQGWIEVQSQPGAGSTFDVFLPLASGQSAQTAESDTEFANARPMRSRTIFVVEDEAPLREMAAKIFKRLGHEVVTAESGPDALRLWPQQRGKIDLLFTDMRMPGGMTGRELAENLLRDEPDLRVIYATGYSVDLSNPSIKLVEGVNLLLKPYDATALARVIKKAFAHAG